jgi:protein TonB
VLSLTLDTNGIPHDVRLIRSLAPSLDEKAIEAVKQYRFKPAMRDGKTPVPTTFRILVEFQLN